MAGKVPLPDNKIFKYSFYKAGTRIFNQGDRSTDIYILKKGAVTVIVDNQMVGLINTPNTFIGEMAYFLGIQRTAAIETIEDSEFIIIPADYLYENVLKNPEIGIELIQILSRRLTNTTKYATRLERDLISSRAEIRQLKGIKEEKKPTFEEELISCGFITGKELVECKEEFKKLIESGGSPSLLNLLIEKKYLSVEQLIQYLEMRQVK